MAKIEGTFQLEGILELSGSSDQEVNNKVNEWLNTLSTVGLIFNKDVEGNYVTLLPDNSVIKSDKVSNDPGNTLCDLLNQLGSIYDGSISSTLRSKEYLKGKEVQIIYLNDQNNNFQKEERIVSCETEAPPEPLTIKEKVKIIIPALLFLIAIIGISSIWVDYKKLFNESKEQLTPVDYTKIKTVNAYDDYFKVLEVSGKSREKFTIKLARVKKGILDPSKLNQSYNSSSDLSEKIKIESLQKGYVRLEFFNGERYLYSQFIRIAKLKDVDILDLNLHFPDMKKVTTLVIRPG